MERIKMPLSSRAKQFAPFDALRGLHEALRQKEKEHEDNIKNKRKLVKIEDED